MASKIGEVLDIEAADSYMKRPVGPMVTIEVKDIAKLAGYIRIPSMAEGASVTDMIRQSILYSGFPNQCQKCRRFEHQARTCNIARNKGLAGATPHNSHTDNSTRFANLRQITRTHGNEDFVESYLGPTSTNRCATNPLR
jgi:hypothetical protein